LQLIAIEEMTVTKITLDRVALKALIDADPDFELELKASVLSEVGRRFFEKDAKRVIAEAEPTLFRMAVSALQSDEDARELVNRALKDALTVRSQWSTVTVKPEVQKEITALVAQLQDKAVRDAAASVERVFSKAIEDRLKEVMANPEIDARIEKRVNRLADEEIERRAREHFNRLKAKIESALS
jgi:uncharacterized membrane-anchored protein YjiN (DUF445 family)